MGCGSSKEDIEDLENYLNNCKKENENKENIHQKNELKSENNKKSNEKNIDKKNNCLTTNSIDKGSNNLSKKEKKTFSSSIKVNEDKIINSNNKYLEEEKNIEDLNIITPRGLNNNESIKLQINTPSSLYNSKEKMRIKNMKLQILESKNESEDELNKEITHKYFSRNEIDLENSNTIPAKFIRRHMVMPKKFNTHNFGGLLVDEEKKLPLIFENLVVLQNDKPSKKYKVLDILGNGSYGKVYRAKNIKTENLVAIKSIKKKKDNGMNGIDIKNEVNILRKVSHPNIVKIYEFYEIKDNYYLIFEFCKYGELFKFIKFHLSEKQLCVLFYQIFSALVYLHENKIIHRDIKLENIMIDSIEKDNITCEPYFFIKIIDFGSAKFLSEKKKENEIIGSSYYIAPEVLKQNYNEKCDTWSAGVLLYMLLTKKAPFNGENTDIIKEKIEEGAYDKNCKKLLDYSPEVKDLLNHLLDTNADKRFSAKQALKHTWFKNFGGRKIFDNFSVEQAKTTLDNLFKFKNNNNIQKLVLAFLAHNSPTTEETLTILKIFRYFNTSGNCKLLKEELREGLYKYKDRKEVDKNVDELFITIDLNKKGYIEYDEFLTAAMDKTKLFTKENLKYAFQFIDKEKSNGIDGKKIIKAFNVSYNKVLEAVFNDLIIKMDEDGDGIINFNEFQKLCLLESIS